ncbi:hypothetical protein GWK91_15070 [Virgibacillus sp. MSP4-1]|uniref:hypothetical protein n=1 Tax=Virgibacillus sp. MSP4-1 TaxID=2700081 RepID=UPI00039C33C6|nr:hypothetical protein [Virgibacillus sp. MSP4-1]QHS24140.1 hypothetical protein GWK91_15070 [Virgibacillus sp. MSP4-1]
MGHDILGVNRAGKEIAYARFSMGNYNATVLYRLLDADDFYAGVSGSGGSTLFSVQQIEHAIHSYSQLFEKNESASELDIDWDLKQIKEFLLNCLTTAKNEGNVKVFFG